MGTTQAADRQSGQVARSCHKSGVDWWRVVLADAAAATDLGLILHLPSALVEL